MAMELYINGVQQTNFILSTPYKDTIDEELDQLNFQIKSTTRLTFQKNDKVRYVLKQIRIYPSSYKTILDKTFCLFNYKESLDGMLWTYQITCLSPTKILENLIIKGMADTYHVGALGYSLGSQAVRVCNKINNQLYYEDVGLTLSLANRVGSLSKEAKEFAWDGEVNVREIFNDIFSVADAIVIGTNFETLNGKITTITIDYQLRTQTNTKRADIDTNGVLTTGNEILKGMSITRDSEFAVGSVQSIMKNGIPKETIEQTYMPCRNTDLVIDEASSRHIITNEPIYSIQKVIALLPVGAEIMYYHNSGNGWVINYSNNRNFMIPIDITNYVVEKNVFDTMSLSQQRKHLYFVRGQEGIYGVYDRYKNSALTSDMAIQYIWRDATIPNYPMRNGLLDVSEYGHPPMYYTDGEYISPSEVEQNGALCYSYDFEIREGAIYGFSVDAKNDTESGLTNILFKVIYQPYLDTAVKIEKTDVANIEANSQNLSVIRNQSDKTIDAEKYYDSQKSFADRMGNKEMNIDAIVDLYNMVYSGSTAKTLWNIGDYLEENTDKWIVVQRTFEVYGEDKIKINYKLSKNFNSSNIDIGLKRDKRLYGIPLDNFVDRYIIIPSTKFNSIDKILIKCVDDYTGGTTTNGYCVKDVATVGNNTIKDKVVRCLDNYAVDIERTKTNSTVVNVSLRYCDNYGYADHIRVVGIPNDKDSNAIYGFNDLEIDDYTRLPFIYGSRAIDQAGYGINILFTEYHNKPIYKDKMERLIFVIKQA